MCQMADSTDSTGRRTYREMMPSYAGMEPQYRNVYAEDSCPNCGGDTRYSGALGGMVHCESGIGPCPKNG